VAWTKGIDGCEQYWRFQINHVRDIDFGTVSRDMVFSSAILFDEMQ
jgi:hypothetical protein